MTLKLRREHSSWKTCLAEVLSWLCEEIFAMQRLQNICDDGAFPMLARNVTTQKFYNFCLSTLIDR